MWYANNNLYQNVNDLVTTLNKYVEGLSTRTPSIIEWVTLGVAIVSVYVSLKSIKKQDSAAEAAIEAENKRTKALIDANLTATARIEWIQNVRQATTELITACYKYMNAEQEEQNKYFELIQEKKLLFILYFGPDKKDDSDREVDLFNPDINDEKNDKLIVFVNNLVKQLKKYHYYKSINKQVRQERAKCTECDFYKEQNGARKYECPKDEYDNLLSEEDCIAKQKMNELKKQHYENYIQEVNGKLRDLSEIVRIYAKIEWDIAKDGK